MHAQLSEYEEVRQILVYHWYSVCHGSSKWGPLACVWKLIHQRTWLWCVS